MKHIGGAVTSIVLISGLLAGCGGGSGSTNAYCDALRDAKSDVEALDGSAFSDLEKAIDTAHELAGKAPDEVAADWKVLDEALSSMEKTVEDAGLKLSDLDGITSGQLPEGVTQEDIVKLGEAMQSLDGDALTKATDNIQKHAKDVCDVDLNS